MDSFEALGSVNNVWSLRESLEDTDRVLGLMVCYDIGKLRGCYDVE